MSVDPLIPTEADLPAQVKKAFETRGDVVKEAMAGAAVPMPPEDLVATLAYLFHDKDEAIRELVKTTLRSIPFGVLEEGIKAVKSPAVLDSLARTRLLDTDLMTRVLRNNHCDDVTFEFVAESAKGPLLATVAANQMRYVRHPQIVRALYFNPNAGMDIVSKVVENAVRAGADLSVIPGWQQVVESIMGAGFVPEGQGATVTREAEPPKPQQDVEPIQVEDVAVDEETLEQALNEALQEVDGPDATGESGEQETEDPLKELLLAEQEADAEDEQEPRSLWLKIEQMDVPQKVRLALVGTAFARSILIRDQRRPVYMAVLESPKLSENEIVSFASDKGLNEELIRKIARNREWTRLYSVKKALVVNPKTPPATAMQLLNYLNKRDLQGLSKSHEVPGYISRKAKQILAKAFEVNKR